MRNHQDAVDHPAHYNTGSIEVIDFIEDQRLGFHLGNVVKYICRAPHKVMRRGILRRRSGTCSERSICKC